MIREITNHHQFPENIEARRANKLTAIDIDRTMICVLSKNGLKISIADAYSIMGDSKNAVGYYRKSISMLMKEFLYLEEILKF